MQPADIAVELRPRHQLFGDGAVSSDPNPTHVYTTPGVYQARLTGTDPAGKEGTTVIVVTVIAVVGVGEVQDGEPAG